MMPCSSKDLYLKALSTALRILTGRDHSRYELSQKLKRRGFTTQVVEQVISEGERLDYINDERTAQVLIRQLKRKGYGKKRIRHELKKKGLRGKRIQGILSESISETDERKYAEEIFQKHAIRFERETDVKKKKDKIYRFLYARGFSKEVISALVRKST